MYVALRNAVVAEVLQRIAQGDCPSPPSYTLETLEQVVQDLATAPPPPTAQGLYVRLTTLKHAGFVPGYSVEVCRPGNSNEAYVVVVARYADGTPQASALALTELAAAKPKQPAPEPKAGPYSAPFTRYNDWTSCHVPFYPVEVCRHGGPGEPDIVVLQRHPVGTDPALALRILKQSGPPYYPVGTLAHRTHGAVQAAMPTTAPTMPPPASADPATTERPTAFHMHEALHATDMVQSQFDEYVLSSLYVQSNPRVAEAATKASTALAELYQLMGAQDYPG